MQIRSARVSFPIAVDLEDATDFDFIGPIALPHNRQGNYINSLTMTKRRCELPELKLRKRYLRKAFWFKYDPVH